MKSDKDHTVRAALASGFTACVFVGACLCVLLALPGCRKKHTAPEAPAPAVISAPDLSGCTRLEFQYLPSTLKFLRTQELLSAEELEYLKSQETFIVDDPQFIKVLADCVGQTTYFDASWYGRPRGVPLARVVCYDDDRRLTSFTWVDRGFIMGEGEQWFKWPPDVPMDPTCFFTPEIRPFVLRIACWENLGRLHGWMRRFSERNGCYPAPGEWCDAFAPSRETSEPVVEPKRTAFQCPAADRRQSHYAMNPNCTPDSPANTVLLFETKAGWNQHGGPELFTFDNHDPKGGCVLLNDLTVKFIRTEEELKRLRWK